jgi:hypothetical protein
MPPATKIAAGARGVSQKHASKPCHPVPLRTCVCMPVTALKAVPHTHRNRGSGPHRPACACVRVRACVCACAHACACASDAADVLEGPQTPLHRGPRPRLDLRVRARAWCVRNAQWLNEVPTPSGGWIRGSDAQPSPISVHPSQPTGAIPVISGLDGLVATGFDAERTSSGCRA